MKIRSIELQALLHAAQGRTVNTAYLDKDALTILAWIEKYRLSNDAGPSPDVIGAKFGFSKVPERLDSFEEVTRILKETYTRKKLEDILEQSDELGDPVQQALFIEAEIAKINAETADRSVVINQSDFEARATQYRKDIASGKTTTIAKFGMPTLDRELHGIEEKNLVIVMARSSGGKSTFARRVAVNMKLQDKRVLYIVMEEDGQQTAMMFDALIAGVPPNDYVRRKVSPEQLDAIITANEKHRDTGEIIVVEDLSPRSVAGVGRAILEHKPDVVILDQITNIVKSTKVEDFTAATRELKQLCRWAPIIALTQMSKAGEAKYSESAFQDADKMLKLSDDPKTPTQDKEVYVEKHRQGRRYFGVPLEWKPSDGVCHERTLKPSPYAKAKEDAKAKPKGKADAAPAAETKDAAWGDEDDWN